MEEFVGTLQSSSAGREARSRQVGRARGERPHPAVPRNGQDGRARPAVRFRARSVRGRLRRALTAEKAF